MVAAHISEAEASEDFPALMTRVRAGEQIIIDSENEPVALLQPAAHQYRTISESLDLARKTRERLGFAPVIDVDCAEDMQEIIRSRKPADRSAWD